MTKTGNVSEMFYFKNVIVPIVWTANSDIYTELNFGNGSTQSSLSLISDRFVELFLDQVMRIK